jgi:hypothetical protein
MSKTDVSEMVNLCKGLGLRVAFETGLNHYSVRDPDSNARLFYISSTPSDSNFKYEIARHLRRLGLLKGNLKYGKFKTIVRKKKYGPIDLVALRKAQEAAESAGERIPLLEDIDGQSEFFRRIASTNPQGYVDEALQEAIDNMAMRLSPRGNATKQRLRKFYEEHPGYKDSEFVRAAMEVAEKRDLRVWPSLNAGQVALGKFKIWGFNLIEATLDHLEGLQWGKIEDEALSPREVKAALDHAEVPTTPTPEYITEETLLNILGNWVVKVEESIMQKIQEDVFEGAPSNGNSLRDRYAESLLNLLNSDSIGDLDIILQRLDKLVGLDAV